MAGFIGHKLRCCWKRHVQQIGNGVCILAMGQAAEACPVVVARGAGLDHSDRGSAGLLRDRSLDLFR